MKIYKNTEYPKKSTDLKGNELIVGKMKVNGELSAFREWAEDNYGQGYHDIVWQEWEKYHSANFR